MRKSIRALAKLAVFNLHPVAVNCQAGSGESWKDNWLLSSARLRWIIRRIKFWKRMTCFQAWRSFPRCYFNHNLILLGILWHCYPRLPIFFVQFLIRFRGTTISLNHFTSKNSFIREYPYKFNFIIKILISQLFVIYFNLIFRNITFYVTSLPCKR